MSRRTAGHLWRIAAPFAVGVAFLALWELVVRAKGIPVYILPGPLAVAQALWTDGPSLLGSLLVTLRVTLAALAAAAVLGGAIALLFSLSRVLALSLFPYAVILQVTTGLAIWKPVQFSWLAGLFGGYPIARGIHLAIMFGIVAFVLVHIALVAVHPRTLKSMIVTLPAETEESR